MVISLQTKVIHRILSMAETCAKSRELMTWEQYIFVRFCALITWWINMTHLHKASCSCHPNISRDIQISWSEKWMLCGSFNAVFPLSLIIRLEFRFSEGKYMSQFASSLFCEIYLDCTAQCIQDQLFKNSMKKIT